MKTPHEDSIPEGMKNKKAPHTLGDALRRAVPLHPGKDMALLTDGITSIEESARIGKESIERAKQDIVGKHRERTGPNLPGQDHPYFMESKLMQHVERELRLAGFDEPDADGWNTLLARNVKELAAVVASQHHSGGTMQEVMHLFERLVIRREPLTELTNDPAEWMDMLKVVEGSGSEDVMRWQNLRNSGAFSADGGKNYWTLNDPKKGQRPPPTRPSREVEPTGPHPVA